MEKYYPRFHDLEKVLIPGPNNTQIYVLALPEDKEVFDFHLRGIVKKRKKILEDITSERECACQLLNKMKLRTLKYYNLYGEEEIFRKLEKNLDYEEIYLLGRLSKWLGEGEISLEEELLLKDVPF